MHVTCFELYLSYCVTEFELFHKYCATYCKKPLKSLKRVQYSGLYTNITRCEQL